MSYAAMGHSAASYGANIDVTWLNPGDHRMRTTVNIDDDLLARAQELTGIEERATLLKAGLAALIERESARRLAALGGSEPRLEPIPRRRPG